MAFGDLTTLGDVKSWLQTGQNVFPTTDDALLTRLITAASQYIQTWLNRQIASQDWIETRDGLGDALGSSEARYQFAAFPVTAVSSVVVDGVVIPAIPTPVQPGSVVGTFAATVSLAPTQLVIRDAVPRGSVRNPAIYRGLCEAARRPGQACIDSWRSTRAQSYRRDCESDRWWPDSPYSQKI